MSASLDRVRRWTRFDHVRQSAPVPNFVARWRAVYLESLTEADLAVLRGEVPRGIV